MSRFVGAIIAVTFALSSASAFAQDGGGNQRSKFYNFDDMLVDGQLKSPEMMRNQARGKAQFKRLLNLKKSFMPKVKESAGEAALQ